MKLFIFYVVVDYIYLIVLSLADRALKSPTVTLVLSISPFNSVNFPPHILKLCYEVHKYLRLSSLLVKLILLSL